MNISSMTGFARTEGGILLEDRQWNWFWELKSVNGKALDLKSRIPPLAEEISNNLKNIAATYFSRGSLSAFLDVSCGNDGKKAVINQELLQQLTEAAIRLYKQYDNDLAKPETARLLDLKGVIELEEAALSETGREQLLAALQNGFAETCQKLQKDRQNEGLKIRDALNDILQKIAAIVAKIETFSADLPQKIRERLTRQIQELTGDKEMISEERLAQELVLYVTRADIREEIDRLKAHVKTAEQLLNAEGAVGRRLDFLCQELNREANTTCSKAADIELTNLGMELKALIEQLREQVQNIE